MLDIYKVGKLMYDIKKPDGMAEWKRDPEAMMTKYGLSEEDKNTLRGKVGMPYYEAGIHPHLLGSGCRFMGLEPVARNPAVNPEATPKPEALALAQKEAEARKKKAEEIAKMFNLVQIPAPQTAGSR